MDSFKNPLQVKKVIINQPGLAVDTQFDRPFNIAMSNNEVLRLKKLMVSIMPPDENTALTIAWELSAKRLQTADLTTFTTFLATLEDDADSLAAGVYRTEVWSTVTGSYNSGGIDFVRDFPGDGLWIPRAPTFSLQADISTANDTQVLAYLYYYKETVSNDKVTALLSKYVGRKQVPVSNIPPTSP